jgi:hypothetical protein
VIVDLATDPDMIARGEALKAQWFAPGYHVRGEALKAQWFAHPTFLAQIEFLWTRIEESLYSDHPGQAETIAAAIETALLGLAKWLDEEQALLEMANRRIRLMLLRLFLHRRLKSGPTSPESWKPGMPQRSSASWNSRLEKIFNMFASMEPWSAGSSDFLFSPRQGGSNRFR